MMLSSKLIRAGALGATAAALLACGGEKTPSADTAKPAAPATGVEWSSSPLTPKSGGKVIEVIAETAASGTNHFVPNEISASPGDVIRYTLKVGVHNVHFVADSNKNQGGFPVAPSDPLQLPGQTLDVLVTGPAGRYYFQCDPHAALGMTGHVTVK